MSKWQQLVITLILTLLIFGAGYGFVASLPFWKIQQIMILNNNNIPENEIIEASGLELNSDSLLKVSGKQLNQNIIAKIDQIREVTLKKKFPDTLILKVNLRKPIIKVYQHNTTAYFDSEAILLTDVKDDTPLLVDAPANSNELRDKIVKHSQLLNAINDLTPSVNIAIYELNDSSLRFTINETAIKFGSLSESMRKLDYLHILIDNSNIDQFEYIDLRVPDNIAVKRRK